MMNGAYVIIIIPITTVTCNATNDILLRDMDTLVRVWNLYRLHIFAILNAISYATKRAV